MSRTLFALLISIVLAPFAKAVEPLLIQSPTLSQSQIAFAYGGEIWIVGRDGGSARLLVS